MKHTFAKTVMTGAVALLAAAATNARADLTSAFGFSLGAADSTSANNGGLDYGVFTIGGSFSATDSIRATNVSLSGNASVSGNVGVAGNYGADGTFLGSLNRHSDLTLSNFSSINGNASLDDFGKFKATGLSSVSGSVSTAAGFDSTHALLQQGTLDARAFATRASGLADTFTNVADGAAYVGFNLGATFKFSNSGRLANVLDLSRVELFGASTFTLIGTAQQAIIVNISKSFTLADTSKIVLSGGLTWNSVVFNFEGTNKAVSFSGYSDFQGYLVSMLGDVSVSDSASVRGEIVAGGSQVTLSNQCKIRKPKRISSLPF